MATRLPRKTCPRCRTECLQDEILCWACGVPFAPRPGGRAAAPTLVGAAAAAPTLYGSATRSGRRGRYLPWLFLAVAAIATGVGLQLAAFWYETQRQNAERAAVPSLRLEPARLPRTGLVPPQTPGSGPASPAAGSGGWTPGFPTPRHARTNRPTNGISDCGLRIAEKPQTMVPRRPSPPDASRTAGQRATPAGPKSEIPNPKSQILNPQSTDAAVAIRNDSAATLDFEFGSAGLSGTVAPYSQIAVPMPTGEYDLTLRSGERRKTLYDVRIEGGQTYRVAFDGRHARME